MESKNRHGCVTAWLILMIVANAATAIVYLFFGEIIDESLPTLISQTKLLILAAIGLANLVFAILLLKWKKWAFWGFSATSLVTVGINISFGLGIGQSMLGLISVAILFGILQIKKDNISAWKNLD